jgi:hypothetical protein
LQRISLASLSLALLLFLATSADAEMVGDDRFTLQGLQGVHVIVEKFSERAERAGFDTGAIRTDVELRLRMAGIRVHSNEESAATPPAAFLYVNVASLQDAPSQKAAFALTIHLKQVVVLLNGKTTVAATWSTGTVGYGDIRYVREALKDHTDEFINDWLSVNPKK